MSDTIRKNSSPYFFERIQENQNGGILCFFLGKSISREEEKSKKNENHSDNAIIERICRIRSGNIYHTLVDTPDGNCHDSCIIEIIGDSLISYFEESKKAESTNSKYQWIEKGKSHILRDDTMSEIRIDVVKKDAEKHCKCICKKCFSEVFMWIHREKVMNQYK